MKRFVLMEDETILSEEPIHWKNYITALLSAALCFTLILIRGRFMSFSFMNHYLGKTVVPVNIQVLLSKIELVILGLFILSSILKIIRIGYIRYYLTNKRIITVSGILNVTFQEMLIDRIEMVFLHQNVYERMYSCGDILCVSAGTKLFMDDVKNAVAFKQRIMNLMAQKKN